MREDPVVPMQDMTNVTVRLSGSAADLVGHELLEYALVPPAKLGTLVEMMCVKHGGLGGCLASCRLTVNGREVGTDTALAEGDEVAIAPAD